MVGVGLESADGMSSYYLSFYRPIRKLEFLWATEVVLVVPGCEYLRLLKSCWGPTALEAGGIGGRWPTLKWIYQATKVVHRPTEYCHFRDWSQDEAITSDHHGGVWFSFVGPVGPFNRNFQRLFGYLNRLVLPRYGSNGSTVGWLSRLVGFVEN